jgi:hypothetical protein
MLQFLSEAGDVGKRAFVDQIHIISAAQQDVEAERAKVQEVLDRRATDPSYEVAFLQVKKLRNDLVGELNKSRAPEEAYDALASANEASQIMRSLLPKKQKRKES